MDISTFLEVIEDLSRPFSAEERYQRLVEAIQRAIPCDAVGVLQLVDNELVPVAFLGLKPEALTMHFAVKDHPRLERILRTNELTRFDADSNLPDPYDGLIAGCDTLDVHDCMGCTIFIDGRAWGVLTLDALTPGTFDIFNPTEIRAYTAAVAAAIKTTRHILDLETQVENSNEMAQRINTDKNAVEIIGKSAAINIMMEEINTVAPSDLSVLITGETGTGKELVAQSIHKLSSRQNRPLIHLNCAALPHDLIESELFGHKKGAFTGAVSDRAGRFELAHGGTLFLDEIGELPLAAQAKLLRALQSGEIQRVGSDKSIIVDVRVIAATNRDLVKELKAGRFRSDLYHRLSVYPIPVPPLRDREEDKLVLASRFLQKNQHMFGIQKIQLSSEAKTILNIYDWPGNVREMEHILSRAALIARKQQVNRGVQAPVVIIKPTHLAISLDDSLNETQSNETRGDNLGKFYIYEGLREKTDAFQKEVIREKLDSNDNNLAAVARELKVDRSNLMRVIRRLGLE